MNKRMEGDKIKISEEREQIEQEVRRIRDLNISLQRELGTNTIQETQWELYLVSQLSGIDASYYI